jgi:NAD(P)-dependent dehydrogenase (short-subunit alcohol dehydrogenase family)
MAGPRFLETKVVAVTGAGRGIGRGIARRVAAEGGRVVVADFGGALDSLAAGQPAVAEEVASEIRAAGGAAVACGENVATAAGAQRVVDLALANWGRIDGLVCAAGLYAHKGLLETSEQEWDDVIASHLRGQFLCTQASARVMREQGSGSIVHFSSAAALSTPSWQTAYATAKAGVLGFSRSVALDLTRYGIRVNCVLPGASTRMTDKIYGEIGVLTDRLQGGSGTLDRSSRISTGVGLKSALAEGTWRDPANVAPFVCFLVSDGAASVHGQAFAVVGYQVTQLGERHYGKTIRSDGPWSLDALAAKFAAEMAPELSMTEFGWPPT